MSTYRDQRRADSEMCTTRHQQASIAQFRQCADNALLLKISVD